MTQIVAKVIIGISTSALNRLFTYSIPSDLKEKLEIGSVVLVPFGKGNQLKEAYVVDIGETSEPLEFELKSISSIKDQVQVEKELIQLAYWIHKRYQSNITSALQLMLPRNIDVKTLTRKTIVIDLLQKPLLLDYMETIKTNKKLQKRNEILSFIAEIMLNTDLEKYYFLEKDILTMFSTSSSLIISMEKLGLLSRLDEAYERNINVLNTQGRTEKLDLNSEQFNAVDQIHKSMNKQEVFLLHGVTGSGKTEVYLQAIEEVLNLNKSAILLIPEIGLTPQTIERFTKRFGKIVGVMHSKLNLGERFEQWQKARNGDVKIMIGARSAIFTPFTDIGIIIIDEEHEHTYKSEQNPRYHAREVAIKRSLHHQCPVVLGSATPLIDNYYKALNNQYKLLELPSKAVTGADKDVHLIDMRQELEKGNMSVLSTDLHNAMEQALLKGEQVILFLNRRGYANSVSCRKCGFVYTCDDCDVSMTYHKNNRRLICHFCGASKPMQKTCPKCDSKYIKGFGAGTQKIETTINDLFPDYTIGRMDQDTTSRKHGHEDILSSFKHKEIDILIGTQMIAKGHDFHNVTVVGVLAADIGLNVDDFRAAEKTFQLITQVIGRTGRGAIKGQAFIQTYQPEHFAINYAIKEDYIGFYDEEILFRKTMIYPPFCHLLNIVTLSEKEYLGNDLLKECVQVIENMYIGDEDDRFMVLGPAKTSIGKIKGMYRYRVIVKGGSYKKLTLVMKELYNRKDNNTSFKQVRLTMDLNPMSLM